VFTNPSVAAIRPVGLPPAAILPEKRARNRIAIVNPDTHEEVVVGVGAVMRAAQSSENIVEMEVRVSDILALVSIQFNVFILQ